MTAHTAVAGKVVELAPADRAVHRRRPAAFVSWMGIGAIGTFADRIHEHLGVIAYPNAAWVGEQFPVSPVYVFATVGFFVLYTLVVGHRGRQQGLFGGRPLSALDLIVTHVTWFGVYTASGLLGAPERAHGLWPFLCAALLLGLALPDLWAARRTWLPLYAVLIALFGVGFEWTATATGGYVYPVCPSGACLGTTVPALWLFTLYLHAALYVHRMLGGRHLLSRFNRP